MRAVAALVVLAALGAARASAEVNAVRDVNRQLLEWACGGAIMSSRNDPERDAVAIGEYGLRRFWCAVTVASDVDGKVAALKAAKEAGEDTTVYPDMKKLRKAWCTVPEVRPTRRLRARPVIATASAPAARELRRTTRPRAAHRALAACRSLPRRGALRRRVRGAGPGVGSEQEGEHEAAADGHRDPRVVVHRGGARGRLGVRARPRGAGALARRRDAEAREE